MNEFEPIKLVDFMAMEFPKPIEWGPWRYCKESDCVEHVDNGYYVHCADGLASMSDAQKWDWVRHISEKRWADAATVGHLVCALHDCCD